jgi:U32 family peptidase
MNRRPELLSPAGNWECLRAAVANGANAVYFGLEQFNARMRADNFRTEELAEIMRYLRRYDVRGFVTFNTLIFTNELQAAERMLIQLAEAGVDAIIVQDPGLARLARVSGRSGAGQGVGHHSGGAGQRTLLARIEAVPNR